MKNKIFIIVNTGTPDKPEKKDVRRFLSDFLNDYRVIDLPWLFRKILVNLIIVPFRTPKSTILYRKLWSVKGSPLLINQGKLVSKLRKELGDGYIVKGAMRYGNPSLKHVLTELSVENVKDITIFPLYPQYASSTTGSVYELAMKEMHKWNAIPEIKIIGQFYSHPSFIEAFACQIKEYKPFWYDHVLFSYHGLPLRHIRRIHPEIDYSDCTCQNEMPEHGTHCYRATCYETTRLLAGKLNLDPENYSTSFQSRLSKDWLTPFTDEILLSLISKGKKKVLVVAPSFVADCLETIVEINDDYKKLFMQSGGQAFVLVESLNDRKEWINAIIEISKPHLKP